MLNIVAIGGGEIGRPKDGGGFYPVETTSIDKEIVLLSGKKKPKLLFIPTASGDSSGYFETVKKHFGKRLNCEVDVLYLIKEKYSRAEIKQKIFSSDIIYVGGGNTLKMMMLWRKLGVDEMLIKAGRKGIVLSGVSAGSICWFNYGNSDSRKFTSNSTKLIKVKGLGLIDALHCPHYEEEENRAIDLKRMMKATSRQVAIALSPCAALEIVGYRYRILKSKRTAKAYKIYWKRGQYVQEEIKNSNFLKISDLLK